MKKKTTHVRVYKKDLIAIRQKFPEVRTADFFHMSVRTNPFLQVEAALRPKRNVKKK